MRTDDEIVTEDEKHFQLGVEFDSEGTPVGDDRTVLPVGERDAVWVDATTVEQFKIDIEILAGGG